MGRSRLKTWSSHRRLGRRNPSTGQPLGCPRWAEILAAVDRLLATYDPATTALLTETVQIEAMSQLMTLRNRIAAVSLDHLHRLDSHEVMWHHVGVTTVSWLAEHERLTQPQAWRMINQGKDLARFSAIKQGALDGDISIDQAIAATGTLADLPAELGADAINAAEQSMLAGCAEQDSNGLAQMSQHLLEVVAPDVADKLGIERTQRQEERARRRRQLKFEHDGHGTSFLSGSLPTIQARLIETVLGSDAGAAERKGDDNRDPYAEFTTRPMRMADALVTVCERIQHCSTAPKHGGDRPRLVVTIPYQKLLDWYDDSGAHEVGSGQQLTAGQLRQLACDADFLPIVLGGDSQILDVGEDRRLVTPAIRAALTVRDRGCIFPGCDKPPVDCEAHHIQPWQTGGPTSQDNLVLLCKHHHRTVEPAKDPATAIRQWKVELHPDTGIPQVIPPAQVDPQQRPRIHQRFNLRR